MLKLLIALFVLQLVVISQYHLGKILFVLQLVVISQYHLGKILDLSGHMETSQLEDSEVSATQEVFTDDLATVYISNVSSSFA